MSTYRNICVFCGASQPLERHYGEAMEAFADELVKRGIGLVFGGGSVGLMGQIADRMLEGGGHVLGVIPHQLQRRELAHQSVSELVLVETMHERKALMYERSDAFLIFPGGFGTLDEAMEILTWKQLGIHDKPIVFANLNGYFDGLETLFQRALKDGLLKQEYLPLYHFAPSVEGIFSYLDSYKPRYEGIRSWA
ncbi:MAG TPA: TIGR00730 family Rossman fold protein [Oscillatoriaceae cyanobacterium]